MCSDPFSDVVVPERPWATFARLYRPYLPRIAGSVCVFVFKQTPVWALPILTGMVIDTITEAPPDTAERLLVYAGIMVFLLLQNVPMHTWFAMIAMRVIREVQLGLRASIVEQLQRLSMGFHQRTHSGAVMAKVLRDVDSIDQMARMILHNFANAILLTTVALITAALTEPWMVLYFLVTVPLAIGVSHAFKSRIARRQKEFRQVMQNMSSRVSDMVELIPVTRAHGLENVETNDVMDNFRRIRSKGLKLDYWTELFAASAWSTFQLALTACFIVSAFMAYWGMLTIGEVMVFHGFFVMIVNAIAGILGGVPVLTQGIEAIESVGEILNSPEVEPNQNKRRLSQVVGEVEMKGLEYSYQDSDAGVRDIDLKIRAGECLALVGESGSGKSTLINVILGFLRPQAGSISIDGEDYDELDLRSMRQFVSVVPQNVALFSGTIRDNITYGLPRVSEERLQDIIDKAQLRKVVDELPAGLETSIGESGGLLSGGQRQRIAIARALIRDPKILVLDEATSALDVRSESLVQKAMGELVQGRTTLIIAHRLSTIRMADRIVVMEKGRILEVGTHMSLLEKDGAYRQLHELNQAIA